MADKNPRIVAELGRPETPEETASRKAAASAAYRSSQTMRHLIAALLITVGIVFVIYLGVPRGEPAPQDPVSVSDVATTASESTGLSLVTPETPEFWQVNKAELSPGDPSVWNIVYAPNTETGYLNLSQAFTTENTWVSGFLQGAAPSATVELGGLVWNQYELKNSSQRGNISYALSYQMADSIVLLYSSGLDPVVTDEFATNIAPSLLDTEEE